ncbi:MAG: CheY-like chemotaxis protein [Octadecabacter sp.]|jgi:CheY-like chemotaxis protein
MLILAVDDDPIILEVVKHYIESMEGYELVTAESVANALEVFQQDKRRFDCFLVDIQMPDIDGIEFCVTLRDSSIYQHTPIIMLTAMSEKSYIDNAFRAGATDYITKPFEINSLKGRLSLVKQVSEDIQSKTANRTTSTDENTRQNQQHIDLHQPLTIFDVDGVIENHAMENYVTQLSRKSLCGSVILGFTVRNTADLYFRLSSYDFSCVITDVSEAISDCLLPTQRLVSYAGNGTFVCVVEGATTIDVYPLVDQINLYIRSMELSASDGTALEVRICAGQPNRLVWSKGSAVLEALREAHFSAEQAAAQLEKDKNSIWLNEHLA